MRTELRMALRHLSFLDSQAGTPARCVELARGPVPKLLVWHPDALDWIFRHDHELGHPGSRSMRSVLGPKSLLWTDGPRYTTYRKLLGPPLGTRRVGDYREVIDDAVERAAVEGDHVVALRLPVPHHVDPELAPRTGDEHPHPGAVPSRSGFHHHSLLRYQATVASRASSSVRCRRQPSSVILVMSTE